MAFGISNTTVITDADITALTNVSSVPELMVMVNEVAYNGYLFFALALCLAAIIFLSMQQTENRLLVNAMYAATATTFPVVFMRIMQVTVFGVERGLLTDKFMYLFPITAILLAVTVYLIKKD